MWVLQQNVSWRSYCWLRKCKVFISCVGAALHTDCQLQNATDALKGFERLENSPDGFSLGGDGRPC